MAEECKNPERTIPIGLLAAMGIAAMLYVAVAITAVSVVPWADLAAAPGPLTEVIRRALQATMKKKLNVEFRPYTILGACNPDFAHKALEIEDVIGTMLPCNVIVQEISKGLIEVSAVDPVASMMAVNNPKLAALAGDVKDQLQQVVSGL